MDAANAEEVAGTKAADAAAADVAAGAAAAGGRERQVWVLPAASLSQVVPT